ncbi:Rieske 2Fe-2S domain-containing protein [Aneurinibacillus sp. Ricciae_BoGa-3]|uniref:Rieske 2Fe-2S domain-containing protein n=1 Tax=Aneurinibacillus sp. Ricciae_BoGa-3 TaxID=3022697 RepID=UPI002342014D|nr:Rieske 2Fe-2S domain-containing protein [Aneurinibacillus sp. Ricciae_BoGa-3]WCK52425.1 Rieske 2Fe-2S domain-containing protein [Aneurinibacillus sp. Ricciae_BoGa-3]
MPKHETAKQTESDLLHLVDNVNRQEDVDYNRRSFLRAMVAAGVTMSLATLPFSANSILGKSKEKTPRVKIIDAKDLPPGKSVVFNYPDDSQPAVLVRLQDGTLKAYNNKCTHLQCGVFWSEEEEKLVCPCHHGFFSVQTGHPIAGPPQRELPLIELEQRNGAIYAVGRKVRHGAQNV